MAQDSAPRPPADCCRSAKPASARRARRAWTFRAVSEPTPSRLPFRLPQASNELFITRCYNCLLFGRTANPHCFRNGRRSVLERVSLCKSEELLHQRLKRRDAGLQLAVARLQKPDILKVGCGGVRVCTSQQISSDARETLR